MKTAMYFDSNGSHLARGMAHRTIAFGSRGYFLKKGEEAIGLEKFQDGTIIGCIVKGTGKIFPDYKKIWPSWKPSKPDKVVCNKVIFKTKLHKIPYSVIGTLSQAGVANSHQDACVKYLKKCK